MLPSPIHSRNPDFEPGNPVFCRFGTGELASTVEATLSSGSTESLLCTLQTCISMIHGSTSGDEGGVWLLTAGVPLTPSSDAIRPGHAGLWAPGDGSIANASFFVGGEASPKYSFIRNSRSSSQ